MIKKNKKLQERVFQPLVEDDARQHLTTLLQVYIDGLNNPQPLFPETAMAWLSSPDDHEAAYNKAKTAFIGGFKSHSEKNSDAYIARIYPDFDAIYNSMTQLAQTVLAPALKNSEEDN